MPNRRLAGGSAHDPRLRGVILQIALGIILLVIAYEIVENAAGNLRRANIQSGFAFLQGRAGFEIARPLIQYTSDSTYARALFVGLLNTILVAVTGVITATTIGFLVGIGRLSHNWLIAKLCMLYVEVFRNLPPLLVVFFWYLGILSVLPQPRQSLHLPLSMFLNNRGLTIPTPVLENGSGRVLAAFVIGVLASVLLTRWGYKRQATTGKHFHTLWPSIGLITGLPAIVFIATGLPISFNYPVVGAFNLAGGSTIGPEFISLFLALSFYTASYIAEIVRSGIQGVPKGQSEAAKALGLQPKAITRLVVIPQALRIIIPPLTSQYLNLTKNSSLAIAVGFSDLVAVGGTTLNQTGHAVEIILIWMIVYLGLSIVASLFMNLLNAKMALVER